MPLDLSLLGSKLSRYRNQFQASMADVAAGTGISEQMLSDYESGTREPSGDHILIIADFYKCDYKFFVSNEKLAPFEQTETLFRIHGDDLSVKDRWAIQEFLYLCECEEFLMHITSTPRQKSFGFQKRGSYFKEHGVAAAAELRAHLGHQGHQVAMDVFGDLRSIGLHVFRRELSNSSISGLFIRHPFAGRCVLVNFSEDVYRQRFTAAHEAGHAILDEEKDVNVSFTKWSKSDLSEVRANVFASRYLMPPEFLRRIPNANQWSREKAVEWAGKLKVSTAALSLALRDVGLIDNTMVDQLKQVAIPNDSKVDVELPTTLSPASHSRKLDMLKRGLSSFYVTLCFRAYRDGSVSIGRLAEMLMVSPQSVHSVATLFGESLANGN